MEFDLSIFILATTFYLIGSLPFALIVHKLLSTSDPRESGSNNPGATNMFRISGPLAGSLTFLGDFLKGFIPIFFLVDHGDLSMYVMSFFLLVGHMFSIFNAFRGGKGVATSFGFLVAIDIKVGLVLLLIWALVFVVKKISGLAAVMSFLSLPAVIHFIISDNLIFYLSIIHSLIILINHKSNIKGILQRH